ncbi:MAG: hypothetical protein ABJN26_05145 [Stappiaceae bacterium]
MSTIMKLTVILCCSVVLSGCAASTDVTLLGSLQGDGLANPPQAQSAVEGASPAADNVQAAVTNNPLPPLTPEAAREQTRQDLQALASSRSAPATAESAASLQELLDLRDGHADRMSSDIEKAAAACEQNEASDTLSPACR